MDYIEEKQDEPFFVYLPYCTPHSPMQVPDEWWTKFEDNDLSLRARSDQKENLPHSQAALAMCENIDWNVGRLMKKLDDLDLAENTIVIYFSDNGPNGYRWNGDMKGRKGSVEEGGVRSPFFIRWPGQIESGSKIDTIAGAIDLKSTLTDLAGIQSTGTLPIDGVSLKPLLLQTGEIWPDRNYINHFKGKTSVRSQRFRLDFQGGLFDMHADPGQRTDVRQKHPEIYQELRSAQQHFDRTVVSELPDTETDERPFLIGHQDFDFTQVPARDANASGEIQRSNRAPNCSYFTNWVNEDDTITWEAEVLEEGNYQVQVYYTCPEADLGSVLELSFGESKITKKVTVANDPPLVGPTFDRSDRGSESFVKDFKPMNLGVMHLKPGQHTLTLAALEKPGNQVIEMRLLMFNRVN